ncbi:hypothetical protein NYP20_01540 [Pseudomonas sp. N3-W]|jgi:hypothetical protein|uniref:hypothetical protein n=1 Tax=Pseudomonas sp. N3-W TaxID=2975049 RepID=UPI00217D4A44|nr:hypothetical protein [Pseudomonas sp. N3-W]UWF49674.1 hypothetical protein NYP20_01540 [Pseudomonas sp. N3-W]
MTPSLITRLCNIALKPGISATTQLITTRRICRAMADQLDVIRSERRSLRRQAGELKAFLPFTLQAIAKLEERAKEYQETARSGAQNVLAGFGQSLMFDREGLAQTLGFDRMCDLLGVNPVHRQQASADGDTSLRGVAYLSQLEDSADRKSNEWGAGGPLYRACHAALIQFIRECPENLLPDPFAPGAPFGPKLPPSLSVVGK